MFPLKTIIVQIGKHLISRSPFLQSPITIDRWLIAASFSPFPSYIFFCHACRWDAHVKVVVFQARNMKLNRGTMGRSSTISESVEAGLRFIGMWPHCIYANINWWTYIASVAVVQYFQYSYILEHFDISDLSVIIDGLSITLGYSLSFLKLINLWFNRR